MKTIARVESFFLDGEYQDGPTEVRVLLPEKTAKGARHPVMYLLPVEPGPSSRYGDPVREAVVHGVANGYGVICVEPTFTEWPWYCDHATNPKVRQESHMLNVVLPFVEGNFPATAAPEGRLLLGFSKSGWGAFSLILRHPDVFGKAAAWDAPMTRNEMKPEWGMSCAFGTEGNFKRYQILRALKASAGRFTGAPRLFLMGHGNCKECLDATHEEMVRLGMAHEYRKGPRREHNWVSGWFPEAVDWLMRKG